MRRTRRMASASLDPRALHEGRDDVCRGERTDHEQPTADAEQRAARKRLTARASTREHGAESHHRATGECRCKSRVAADVRTAFDLEAEASSELRRDHTADRDAKDLEHEPVEPRIHAVADVA